MLPQRITQIWLKSKLFWELIAFHWNIKKKNYKHLCSKEIFLAYVTAIRCYGYVQNVFEKKLLRNKTNSLKFLNRTYDFKVLSFT